MATKKEREAEKRRKLPPASDWARDAAQGRGSKHLKLPEGVELYKLEIGEHEVDFMPYLVGKNNPRADKGLPHYVREYRCHALPGPDGKSSKYCCRADCFGEPCPPCKLIGKGGLSKELYDTLKQKFRMLWLINDKPGATDPRKIKWKVLDIHHYNRGHGFGELMADAINILRRKGGDPFDLEEGFTAILTVKEQSMPGSKFNDVTRIDFTKRDYSYPEEVYDHAPCLDAMLVDPTVEGLAKVLESGEDIPDAPDSEEGKPWVADDDEDDKPVSRSRPARREEPDEDEDEDDEPKAKAKDADNGHEQKTAKELGLKAGDIVTHRKHGECKIVRVSKDGTSLVLEDNDDHEFPGIPADSVKKVPVADDDEDGDDEDEDDKPKAKAKAKPAARKARDDDDDEDEDDE